MLVLGVCAFAAKSSAEDEDEEKEKKKKKEVILSTEYHDSKVGAEVAEAVEVQMGLIKDPKLDAYVSGIGRKLLRGMPRNSFRFKFSVVDQVEPNAFALPGGYIYISRGLLTLANDEDELANVIGHEITHAAHRHAAAQQELRGRMIPILSGWKGAMDLAAYGRDMERDADRGGQILAAAAGYDPMGMSTFLRNMGQVERLTRGASRSPSFFDTHPGATERAAVNAARVHELRWRRDPSLGDPRAALLRVIDGIAVAQRPEAGVFQGDIFLHPDLDFRLRFPPGWRTQNTNQAVGATTPRGDAMVYLMADQPEGEPREMAEAFVERTNKEISGELDIQESKRVMVGRLEAWRMLLQSAGRSGNILANVTFIPYHGATWRITGASPAGRASRYLGRTLATARSFRPLTPAERASIQSQRLRVVEARSGESLEALTRRTRNAWDVSRTAVYNGIFSNHRFKGGELVKISHIEPYTPKARSKAR
jgi:predicted Zn-dependent protease